MQNEKGKFKGTIVSLDQIFKGSNDRVFPLETQTRRDVEVPLIVFQQNEERGLESERQDGKHFGVKTIINCLQNSSFVQTTACLHMVCVTAWMYLLDKIIIALFAPKSSKPMSEPH